MATKKAPGSTSATRSRATSTRRTTRRRRTTSSALQLRRRASRPGLPTTVGAALGTLVVTTLLDLSWPARVGLIVLVLVVGLAYVVWKSRAHPVDSLGPASDPTDPPAPSSGQ